MHLKLHTVSLRMILVGGFCIGLALLVASAVGQTNLDADTLPTERFHDLSPIARLLPFVSWVFPTVLLAIAAVLVALRHRAAPSLYQSSSDTQWKDDAQEDVGDRVEVSEVMAACAALEPPPPVEAVVPPAEAARPHQARLFAPASGPAWDESMLKAFLRTCMKVNCLGRIWRESAEWRSPSSNQPDPREAELMRRFMQRWQEFHVDPEIGVFLEHSTSAGKSRVCIIRVSKDKHTLVEAALNAGFVIESVGRYLKSTDLVYRRDLGDYHSPAKEELTTMTPGEKESLMRVTDIPDPWQAMIGARASTLRS